jgi:pSer/pThr/pTyr-binding forkhead associated (FHA) protein
MAMPSRIGLTATTGPYTGQTFPITEQEFWIGSAANNHLCLAADQGVSGNHACIRTEESFRRLYDNESLNNTWLNGRPVGREIAIIQPGDHIRLGASDFLVETNADA